MNQETKRITELANEARNGDYRNCKELVSLLKKRVAVKVRKINLYEAEQDEIIEECMSLTLCYAIKTWDVTRAQSFLTYFYLQVRATIWNKCVVLHNRHQAIRLNSVSIQSIEDWQEPGEESQEIEFNDIVSTISRSLSPTASQAFEKLLQEGHKLNRMGAPKEVIEEIQRNRVVQEVASQYVSRKGGRAERVWQ